MGLTSTLKHSWPFRTWTTTEKPFHISKDLWLALAVAAVAVIGGITMGWDNYRVVISYPYPGFHYLGEPQNFFTFFSNWDSVDYLHIAQNGYSSLFWVNWFPLYPITIYIVQHVLRSALDSALFIAWVSFVGACFYYLKVVRRLFNITAEFEPLKALLFFVLFPTGVFLIAPFSESLYALLALGSIYFALQKRVLPAAVMAMFCTATHITGPLVVILIALILWEEKVRLQTILLTAVVGSLGLASYMTFLLAKFHRPLAFLESQQIYHHWSGYGFFNLISTATPSRVLSIVFIILAACYWWKRRRSLAVYSLLFLGILIAGRQYGGFDRYVLMDFPIPLMVYGWLRSRVALYPYVATLFGITWTYYLLQYAGGYTGS